MGGLDILRARGPERYLEGNWYYLGMPKNVGPHFLPFGPTFFHEYSLYFHDLTKIHTRS